MIDLILERAANSFNSLKSSSLNGKVGEDLNIQPNV